jgi:hypothetical protein
MARGATPLAAQDRPARLPLSNPTWTKACRFSNSRAKAVRAAAAAQKRRLVNFVLSNCSWKDGEARVTFRQPFDLLAETTAMAARQEAENTANSAKSEIWLGN